MWLLLLLLIFPVAAEAKQLGFQRQFRGHSQEFSYRWLDRNGAQQQLRFSLNAEAVKQARAEIKPFSNQQMNEAIIQDLKKMASQFNQRGKEVSVHPTLKGYSLRYKGFSSAELSQLKAALAKQAETATARYLTASYYQKISDVNVMIDHKAVAIRYKQAMRPVAEAILRATQGLSQRERLNYTLNFLQNIPYDQLQSRYTANGAGFQTPYGMLYENQGDCDTKAVALAALLAHLAPRNRVVIVYTPGHAFVGIQAQQGRGDFALRLGNSTFVLMDPTGPALAVLGDVSPESEVQLRRGNYSYQEVAG